MSGTRTIKLFSLLGVVLVVALAAIACSSEPAPAMDESRLQRIVESAVAKSAPEPQPQISADEIQTIGLIRHDGYGRIAGFGERDSIHGGEGSRVCCNGRRFG